MPCPEKGETTPLETWPDVCTVLSQGSLSRGTQEAWLFQLALRVCSQTSNFSSWALPSPGHSPLGEGCEVTTPHFPSLHCCHLAKGLPLEAGMATHSSSLAWRILWTEEPGRLQSMGCRVRHD